MGVKLLGAQPGDHRQGRGPPVLQGHNAQDRPAGHSVKVVANDLECRYGFRSTRIGYPVIVRPAFTLGGTGGGIADERGGAASKSRTNGLQISRPSHQILVEKCISGWKEIEFEVIRDSARATSSPSARWKTSTRSASTPATRSSSRPPSPCRIRNTRCCVRRRCTIIDRAGDRGRLQLPVRASSGEHGIRGHRGQSPRLAFLRARVQGDRISDREGRGEDRYRLYPSTRSLNAVTGKTYACFEPALDYVVVKFPKWPFDKFVYAQAHARHPDEGDRRGHGDRHDLRAGDHEGGTRRSSWVSTTLLTQEIPRTSPTRRSRNGFTMSTTSEYSSSTRLSDAASGIDDDPRHHND